jgi:hypothetical protein
MSKQALTIDKDVKFTETNTEFEQRFCSISFLSPEVSINRKLINDISKFVYYEFNKKIKEVGNVCTNNINLLISKLVDDFESLDDNDKREIKKDLSFNVQTEENNYLREYMMSTEKISNLMSTIDYKPFEDQCNIHGIKIRGVFTNIQDANNYCLKIKKDEPNINIFVTSIGHWSPTDPFGENIAHKTYDGDVNTLNPEIQLQTIMNGYNDNKEQKDNFLNMEEQDKINSQKVEDELREKTRKKIAELKKLRTKK